MVKYVFASVAITVALLLRSELSSLAGGSLATYITVYPAVMLVALLGGFGPGVFATITAVVATDYYVLEPRLSFAVASAADMVGMALFTGMGIFMSVVAELYRRARRRISAGDDFGQAGGETRSATVGQPILLTGGLAIAFVLWVVTDWRSARHLREIDQVSDWDVGTHLAGDVLSFLLLVAIFLYLKQENRRRTAAEAGLREHRDHLKELVAERTTALDRSNDQLRQELDENLEAREALRESRERLDMALISSRMATFEWDIVHDKRTWSEGVHRLLGTCPETFDGSADAFLRVMPAEDRVVVRAALAQAVETTGQYETDYRAIWPDGSIRHISARGKVHHDNCGRPVRMTGVCWDVTELKENEQEMQKLNRTLKALKESSQAMVCASSEAEYLRDVCQSVISTCGYAMVWIGFAQDDETRSVRPAAFSGFEEGYLETLTVSWADNEYGRGPTGTAIRTGRPAVCRNMLLDPAFAPWRGEAIKRGYASSVVVPLLKGGHAFGAITIYSRQPDSFSGHEVELLEELAEGVSTCIHSLRAIEMRRETEQQLRLLSSVVEAAANGIAVTDRNARILWVNPAFSRLTGYTREEAVGQNPRILKSGQHSPEFYREMWRTLLRGEPWQGELVNRAKDGSLRREEMTITPVKSNGDQTTHYVAIKQDITARKRAERRTELLAETASRLLSSDDPQPVVDDLCRKVLEFLDAHLCLMFLADEGTNRLRFGFSLGLSGDEAAKLASLDYCSAMCGSAAAEGCQLVAQRIQEVQDPRTNLVRPYGVRAYTCHPLTVAGVLLGTLSFGTRSRDAFTDDEIGFVRTLCDLMATSLERARLTRDLARARDLAERANVAKDNFLAALSHELRTPLSPVLVLAEEAAADATLPSVARDLFGTIVTNVRLEARLIDDLLDLSRITNGKLALDHQVLDVHAALKDAIETVRRDFEEKRLRLTVKLGAEKPTLVGDAVRLRQIFWNVLRNAVKFTPPAGAIVVETVPLPGDRLRVLITDTGIGMTPAELERIFTSFSQGDHANGGGSHRFGGLGLGLSISRTLVEMHAGTIRAESAGRNQGATFVIELPLRTAGWRATPGLPMLPSESNAAMGAAGTTTRARRILLVEDHEPTRMALTALLSRRRHVVVAVGSVAEARAAASGEEFDLLISDLGLPDGTGYELASELVGRHGLKAIALSGYGRDDDIVRGREAGFIAHLIKPVSIRALEQALAGVDGPVTTAAAVPGAHGGSPTLAGGK